MWVEDMDEAVLGWLSSHLVHLRSLEPASGHEDLEPLRKQFEGIRIVGLGESTHGVHEFFEVKHRLVEFLVAELGFTVLALEASYAACQPINRYVMHGIGDPAAVLSGQHYLAWDTEEFAALGSAGCVGTTTAWVRTARCRFTGWTPASTGLDVSRFVPTSNDWRLSGWQPSPKPS